MTLLQLLKRLPKDQMRQRVVLAEILGPPRRATPPRHVVPSRPDTSKETPRG
ncbi:MAG: hypothetical protein ACON5B_08425 [Myxococcota bacterium]